MSVMQKYPIFYLKPMRTTFFKSLFVLAVLLLLFVDLFAQKTSQIEIRKADYFRSDKNIRDGARRLIGHVKFWQDSTIMLCDSAYFLSEKNMFEAYGNVHLYKEGKQNIDVRSAYLKYNGNTKMAYFRKDVVMRDTQVVLYTDSLDYDTKNDIGYYLYGAQIVDSATTLTSVKGHYYNQEHTIYFKDKVVVNHNQGEYQMYTDTLKYNTDSEITYFFGPTEFYNDSNYMFAKFGWYNTQNNIAFFKRDAYFTNSEQQVQADSIYYERDIEHGKAFSNIIATDTAENIEVHGNFMELFKDEDKFYVTDSALLIHVIDDDTLFMHADTLFSEMDSTGEYRIFRAYYHTKIFKLNFQAKTDSLVFSMQDSIIRFYGSPILWAEENQISATYIEGFVKDEKLDRFKLYDGGLIISKEDSSYFNQVKGLEMIGYLRNNSLSRIDVFKRSETIYFPVDEYGIMGVNKSQSANISILLKDNKISRLIYRENYDGSMYPLEDLQPSELKVKGFEWNYKLRPLQASDVFLWDSNTFKIKNPAPEQLND
jgi:lipopolysaccharide export system protein LptA